MNRSFMNKLLVACLGTAILAMPLANRAFALEPWVVGTGTSKIYIQNIDPSGTATYAASFYGQTTTGSPDLTINGSLVYQGNVIYDVSTVGGGALPSGWTGSVVVSSDRQIAAIAKTIYTGNQFGGYTNGSPDGKTDQAYSAFLSSSQALYFPYVTQAITTSLANKRFSVVTIQNTTSGNAPIYFQYRSTVTGNIEVIKTDTIPGYRAKSYDLGDPSSANFPGYFSTPAWNGSLVVTSTVGIVGAVGSFWQDTSGVAGQLYGGWSSAYTAATSPDTTLYAPNVFRRIINPDPNPILGEWSQWSNLFIQNTSAITAHITVSYTATGSSVPSYTVPITIPGYQARELNTRFGGTSNYPAPADFLTNLGNMFAGSVVIKSDQPIVGVVHSFWGSFFNAGSSANLVGSAGIARTWYVPYAPRSCSVNPCPSASTLSGWLNWSKVAIMNVSGGPVNVTAQYVNANGTPQGVAFTLNSLQNGSVDAFNTRFGSDSGAVTASQMDSALGATFEGGAVISATGNIVVTVIQQMPEDIENWNAIHP